MSNKRMMDSTFAADDGDPRFLDEHLPSSDQEVRFIPEAAPVVFQGVATRSNPTRIVVVGEAITDALAALVAFAAFNASDFGAPAAAAGAVVAALVWLGLLAMFRAYDPAGNVPLRSFLGAMGVGGLAAVLVGGVRAPIGAAERLGVGLVVLGGLELVGRTAWSWYRRRGRETGWLRLRTAIVGRSDDLERVNDLLTDTDCDMLPVAWIAARAPEDGAPMPDLSVLSEGGIECLLVASDSVEGHQLDTLRHTARAHDIELRVLAGAPETPVFGLRVRSIGHNAVISVPRPHLTGPAALAKRTMDVILGSAAFALFLPLMMAMVIGIKITSPGPAFFRQTRVTKGGRPFRIVKFRTMRWVPNEEDASGAKVPFFKQRDDPRLTKAGRLIRRLSADELPQLWNVLKGEMSLVGPRPLPIEQVASHPELLGSRHEVRSGMTGWWQVNGRSDIPAEEAVKQDLFYIENWTLALDVRIIVKTVKVLFHRKGAY